VQGKPFQEGTNFTKGNACGGCGGGVWGAGAKNAHFDRVGVTIYEAEFLTF
jgi:hypothetical protein